jgi:hypothetical protein
VREARRGSGAVRSRARGALARTPPALALAATMSACAALASGCGGGSRQDAGEPKRSFTMEIVGASFPAKQAVARPARMLLRVRNTGTHTVPDVAITVDSFNYTATTPELAANKRPVWAIEQGPGVVPRPPVQSQEVSQLGAGQTAYVNTWALGPLAPGRTQTFSWRVVPVKAGSHTVRFAVAAGLSGHARAALSAGGAVQGRFTVNIAPAPPITHVDPQTGKLVVGAFPPTP